MKINIYRQTDYNDVSMKNNLMNLKIPTPCVAEVEKYLNIWNTAKEYEKYRYQEKSVVMMFKEKYPANTKIEEILVKVSVLNDFYGTNIRDTFSVAQHIVNIANIDSRLVNADIALIDDIARVKIKGKEIRFYSFATKYCSHHNPTQYPIFDNFVSKVLVHFEKQNQFFNKQNQFYSFKVNDLRGYDLYKTVVFEFRKFFGLERFCLRKLDLYLWSLGKEYFSKNITV